jgi:hypothetical protein
MAQKPLTAAQKFSRWQKIYKKIKREIREQGLEGAAAVAYYQQRVYEEKMKMLK